jgi:hypothetical protein
LINALIASGVEPTVLSRCPSIRCLTSGRFTIFTSSAFSRFTTALGVFAGRTMLCHVMFLNPGSPDSETVGRSGKAARTQMRAPRKNARREIA